VAVLNPRGDSVEVTVEAFDQAGDQVGENTFWLPGEGRRLKKLGEVRS